MAVIRKAKARFLQSMREINVETEDDSSQNEIRSNDQSPSENAENEHKSTHENEAIDNDYNAPSNNQSSHENEEIEHEYFLMSTQKRMTMRMHT